MKRMTNNWPLPLAIIFYMLSCSTNQNEKGDLESYEDRLSNKIYVPIVGDTTDRGWIEASSLEAPKYLYDYLREEMVEHPSICEKFGTKTLIIGIVVGDTVIGGEARVYTFDDENNLLRQEKDGKELVELLVGAKASDFAFIERKGNYGFRIEGPKLCLNKGNSN